MYDLPIHPDYQLAPSARVDMTRYLTPGAAQYSSDGPVAEDSLDALVQAQARGLEALVERVGELIEARQQAGRDASAAISRDLTYLENLIIDCYRHGQRATEDRTYVKLRLEQLRLHSEMRQESVSCWRDTVLLAKELADLVRRAGDARTRETLLLGDGA